MKTSLALVVVLFGSAKTDEACLQDEVSLLQLRDLRAKSAPVSDAPPFGDSMAASALKELPEHVDLMLPLPESSDDDIMVPLPDWSDDDTKDTDDSLQEDVPLPESTGDDIMLPLSDWSDDANKDIDNPLQEETFTDSAPKESTNSSSVDVPNQNHSEGASLMQEANWLDPPPWSVKQNWAWVQPQPLPQFRGRHLSWNQIGAWRRMVCNSAHPQHGPRSAWTGVGPNRRGIDPCADKATAAGSTHFQTVAISLHGYCWHGNHCNLQSPYNDITASYLYGFYTRWDLLQGHLVHADACDTTPVSKEWCFAYGLQVHLRHTGHRGPRGRDHLVEGDWHWIPPGCSVQTGGDWAVHWNNGYGHNDGGYYHKVCHGNDHSHHPTRVIGVHGAGIFWETDGTRHHVPTCHMCNRNFCNSQWYQEVDQHYLNSLTPGPTFHCGILSG